MNDQPPAAFYCVSSRIYFLGAVAMINSLRLNGHREPIYVLDAGLSDDQRQLLAAEVTIVEAPSEAPPYLLKTVAPLAHPAEVMVLIDVDMIVCRSLGELIERAAEGRIVAFENNMDRFVEQWGELTGLGEARRGPYVSSGFVAAGSTVGAELLALVDRLQRSVELDLTVDFSRQDLPEHPFRYLDQDVLNAILRTAIEPGDLIALDTRLAPTQPFDGLRLFDASGLRCAYRDGTEPYLLHHYLRKPWLEGVYHGVYSRFLARLLVGDELAITVPREQVPPRMRIGSARPRRADLGQRDRPRALVPGRPAAQAAARPARPRRRQRPVTGPPAAFYCVADARYFLGAVAMINSLRLNGHREPIYLLDAGLSDDQRELLAQQVRLVASPYSAFPCC